MMNTIHSNSLIQTKKVVVSKDSPTFNIRPQRLNDSFLDPNSSILKARSKTADTIVKALKVNKHFFRGVPPVHSSEHAGVSWELEIECLPNLSLFLTKNTYVQSRKGKKISKTFSLLQEELELQDKRTLYAVD